MNHSSSISSVSEDWISNARNLQRADELLKPYLSSKSIHDRDLRDTLDKVQGKFYQNAQLLHDIEYWHRAASLSPRSSNHEAIMTKASALINELNAGINEILQIYAQASTAQATENTEAS